MTFKKLPKRRRPPSEKNMQLRMNPNELRYWRMMCALLTVCGALPRSTLSDLVRYALRLVEKAHPQEAHEALLASREG